MVKGARAAEKTKAVVLTAQEAEVWRWRHRKEISTLNPEQKKAFNKYLRQKLSAMDEAELAKTRAALQKDWDAMPVAPKGKMTTRMANKAKKTGAAASA